MNSQLNPIWKEVFLRVKEKKIKNLEKQFDYLKDVPKTTGVEKIICPFCNYQSKNGNSSGRIFTDNNKVRTFKCFNCGIWRKIG